MGWRSMSTAICMSAATRPTKSGESAPIGRKTLLAHDRWGIRLGRPTNLAFGGENFDEIYVANLGRYTITRAKLGIRGQPLANLQVE